MKNILKKIIITLIFTYLFTLTAFASFKSSTLTADYGVVASTATFSSTTLLATTSGNVGIGTVTPTTKLEVNGNVKANSIQASSFTFNGSQYITGISTDTALNISNDNLIATVNAIKNYVTSFANYNPPGAILPYAASTAPSGYLLCDGSAISRTTYANLFSVIGTTYGTGNGLTTFNIPDLRGVFLRGIDNMGTGDKNYDTGRVFGSYQGDDYKSHNHQLDYKVIDYTAGILAGDYFIASPGRYDHPLIAQGTVNYFTNSTGGTETRPKNIAVNYIIKY